MNLLVIPQMIRKDLQNLGLSGTVSDLAVKVINRLTYFRIIRCVTISKANPFYLETGKEFSSRLMQAEDMKRFCTDPVYDLTEEFIAKAAEKGDECLAIFCGDALASYGWYSKSPTDVYDGLQARFNKRFVYMYHGYTHPDYRGKRLHAIGMTLALQEYLQGGYQGLVSFVEATNANSLKSVIRMGYREFGSIYVLRSFGRFMIFHSRGCQECEFRFSAD